MKKHLKRILSFAVTLLMAFTAGFTLTGCGEEVTIGETPTGPKEGMTVFSSVADNTRTTIDNDGLFYWQSEQENGVITNDQIWIDKVGNGASFSLQSSSSQFEDENRSGKFYFREALDEDTYKLSYTGLGSTTGDKVTIAAEQLQLGWDTPAHIGKSGDCATATARKQSNGNYTFTLEHKANYLIFQPFAPASTDNNQYHLVDIEIVDTESNALCGTFPLKYDGLKTNGAENTSNQIRMTCKEANGESLRLPTSASKSLYAVILPRGAAEGGRALQLRYKVHTTGGGDFIVVQNISDKFEANGARLIKQDLSMPTFPSVPTILSDGNGKFGGVKFKPAFLRRTNGNATIGANLQLDADPFVLLQYNQGAHGTAPTEFQKRMWFTWNELVEIFGHVTAQGQGASYNGNITNAVTIGGKQHTLPSHGQYTRLIRTPNAGRATVNYYPASYAAVKVDLSADATYASKGWNHTSPYNANANANYIMGYLFFPDESIILDAKILVASLNGRWGSSASNLTAAELRSYTNRGCMFLSAAGDANPGGWFNRGGIGNYWSGTIVENNTNHVQRLGITSMSLDCSSYNRPTYYSVVLVEN